MRKRVKSKFPLLKLPMIPLENILDQMDFLELLQLSMKSSKFKRLLELLKLPVQTLNICITEGRYRIKILRNSCFFHIDACDSVPMYTIPKLANIQGEPVQFWKHRINVLKVKSDLSKLATLETITKRILSISKVAKYSLTYDDAETEIRSLFIWQITTQMDQLHISSNNSIRGTMSPEDLKFILDGPPTECLFLNVFCPGFKYQKPIRHPKIHIRCPLWLDFDQFSLGPETITAHFTDQKVSNANLNRLIKDWTEGKCPKLREVKFTWTDNGREHEARPPRTILPNRNVEQLKGLCINYSISNDLWNYSVYYTAKLSVKDDFGLIGIHLED